MGDKVTADVRETIRKMVAAGLSLETAADAAGVGARTVHRRLERDRAFREDLVRARAEATEELLAGIRKAANRGSWRAAIWMLENLYADQWSTPASADDAPTVDGAVNVRDELAALRAAKS